MAFIKIPSSVSTITYKGKRYINVLLKNNQYSLIFDYKTLDLVHVDDVHTGEWATFDTPDEIAWFKKRSNNVYTYGRRLAREYKK